MQDIGYGRMVTEPPVESTERSLVGVSWVGKTFTLEKPFHK